MQIQSTLTLKTAVGATPPWVRIPPLPPITNGNIRHFGSGKTGTKRFASDAKSEQNASNNEYTVPKNEYSDSGDSPSVPGGEASERWRSIPGLVTPEWGYEASNLGRIRNVYTGRVRSQTTQRSGHKLISLWVGHRKSFHVHRLIALAWCDGYSEGLVAAHWNGDPSDNRPENLRWTTQKDNLADQLRHGTRPRGTARPNAKLNDDSVREIRRLNKSGVGQPTLAKQFGVSQRAIVQVLKGLSWSHVGGDA